MTTHEAIRQTGLGGSDIAAVVGWHPWKRAYDVWMDKIGIAPPDEMESEAAYWGKVLEPVLCDEYARRENVRLVHPPFDVVRSAEFPWMLGSPDRFVDGQRIGVDVKMAGLRQARRWGQEGSDFVPDEYVAQAQWYLALTDYERWDVAVLLGQRFKIYRVFPHRELQEALIKMGGDFWRDYVEPQIPPTADQSEAAKRMLQQLYPREQEPLRPATGPEILFVSQLRQVTHEIDRYEQQRNWCLNQLRAHIGLADGIEGPGFKVTWRRTKDRRTVNWESLAKSLLEKTVQSTEIKKMWVDEHTETKPGMRVLRPWFKTEDDDDGDPTA